MKKLILLLLFIPLVSFGQEFKYQDKIMSVVFKVDSLSASEIHSRALNAIANLYNNANNVIQLNDTKANKIVLKGSSNMTISNVAKALMPNNPFSLKYQEINYKHTINIDSKDGRYRIVFSINSPTYKVDYTDYPFAGGNRFTFDDNLKVDKDVWVRTMTHKPNGKPYLNKKKTESYRLALLKSYDEVNKELKREAEATSLIINDAVQQNPALDSNSILNDDF